MPLRLSDSCRGTDLLYTSEMSRNKVGAANRRMPGMQAQQGGNAGNGAVDICCMNITFLPFSSHINPCWPHCSNQARDISHKVPNYSIFQMLECLGVEVASLNMPDAQKINEYDLLQEDTKYIKKTQHLGAILKSGHMQQTCRYYLQIEKATNPLHS